MQITTELLEKYHLNQCTAEEKAAVEKWLEEGSDNYKNITAESEAELFLESRQDMLSWIGKKKIRPALPLYRNLFRYGAAACILIGVFALLVGKQLFSKQHFFENNLGKVAKIHTAGADLSLRPNTKVELVTNFWNKQLVQFCGDFALENKLSENIEVEIASQCDNGEAIGTRAIIKAGRQYAVFRESGKIQVVDLNKMARPTNMVEYRAIYHAKKNYQL